MVARQSELFIPTLREPPADAESVSHKLLVRGGYIRQLSAGVWTFLPLGWRVHQKVVQIIREEMNAIGGQEMLMPVLTPIELWQQTKRDQIEELFRLKDRSGRDYVLPMTHEETVTFHAKEIGTYRRLPQVLYHFSIKERDELRSRGGLLRPRRGGSRGRLPQERRGVPPDVRAGRPRVLGRPGRVRDDGREGVAGLPRAVRFRREHA